MQLIYGRELVDLADDRDLLVAHPHKLPFGAVLRGCSWKQRRPDMIAFTKEDIHAILNALESSDEAIRHRALSYLKSMCYIFPPR